MNTQQLTLTAFLQVLQESEDLEPALGEFFSRIAGTVASPEKVAVSITSSLEGNEVRFTFEFGIKNHPFVFIKEGSSLALSKPALAKVNGTQVCLNDLLRLSEEHPIAIKACASGVEIASPYDY